MSHFPSMVKLTQTAETDIVLSWMMQTLNLAAPHNRTFIRIQF